MKEKKSTGTIDYETPIKRHKERQRRLAKIDNIIMLVVAIMLGLVWWWSTLREPIEFTYCGIDNSKTRAPHKCAEYKLRIPFIYFGGYPLDFSRKVPGDVQSLEVAYPSMQPWHSLSILEKWNSQKIEINFWVVTSQTVKDLITLSSFGSKTHTVPTTRAPEPVYGLVQYLSEPVPHFGQFLFPQEPSPRMYLSCAYRASNPDINNLGCSDRMFTEWGLSLELHHKLILLPHWSDIYDKVQGLIQSFVVKP